MKYKTLSYFTEKGILPYVAYAAGEEWLKQNVPTEVVEDLIKTMRMFDEKYCRPARLLLLVESVSTSVNDNINKARHRIGEQSINFDLLRSISDVVKK